MLLNTYYAKNTRNDMLENPTFRCGTIYDGRNIIFLGEDQYLFISERKKS